MKKKQKPILCIILLLNAIILFFSTKFSSFFSLLFVCSERDIMGPNAEVCPKLKDIEKMAKQSQEYQDFNNSETSQKVRAFLSETLGETEQNKILDCLMTTICTDRYLPQELSDYGKKNSMFQALAEYDIQSYNLIMKYNNSGT